MMEAFGSTVLKERKTVGLEQLRALLVCGANRKQTLVWIMQK